MSAASQSSLHAGDRLGEYEIVKPIGEGGMAQLFVARAPTGIAGFRRVVALKRILPQLSADPEFVDMFMSEAQLAGLLRHPNIATLHEFGRAEGETFFTMEYVHGVDLRKLIRRAAEHKRGLKLGFVLTIISAVAAGLHHAHELRDGGGHNLGIVHRDVSPTNILIGYDGSIKVVDFGIAKALTRRTKTRTGQVKGKVRYLSPEQCKGDPIDRRSDIFSLAIILYELTTGRRMFAGKDDFAIMHQLVNEPVAAPSSLRDDYDPELEVIAVKALQSDPDDRYETAQDFQEALEDFARESKLSLSTVGLGRFMRELYGDVPEPAHEITNPSREKTARDVSGSGVSADSGTAAELSKSHPLPLRGEAQSAERAAGGLDSDAGGSESAGSGSKASDSGSAALSNSDLSSSDLSSSGDATNNSLSQHVPASTRDHRDGIWRTIAALAVAGMVATAVLAASGVFGSGVAAEGPAVRSEEGQGEDGTAQSASAAGSAEVPRADPTTAESAGPSTTAVASASPEASASTEAQQPAPARKPITKRPVPHRANAGSGASTAPALSAPAPSPPPVLSDGGFWN